jgi:hypothetical protein
LDGIYKQSHGLNLLIIEEDVATLEHEKFTQKQNDLNLILAETYVVYFGNVMRNYNVIIECFKDHSLRLYETLSRNSFARRCC